MGVGVIQEVEPAVAKQRRCRVPLQVPILQILVSSGRRHLCSPPSNRSKSCSDTHAIPHSISHYKPHTRKHTRIHTHAHAHMHTRTQAPRAAIFLSLNSAGLDSSARSAALVRMLLEVLELRINEARYMAEEAGVTIDITNYSFSAPCYGLRLLLHGFTGKLEEVLQDVVRELESLSITEEVFGMAKEKAETDYRNRKFQQVQPLKPQPSTATWFNPQPQLAAGPNCASRNMSSRNMSSRNMLSGNMSSSNMLSGNMSSRNMSF